MSAHTPGLDPRCTCRAEPGRFLFCPMHAAAPALLAALKVAREYIAERGDESSPRGKAIAAAIAKAEDKP